MPLTVLLPLVAVSMALVTLATWALGGTRLATLDPDRARERFLVDHPELAIEDVAVARDGLAALVWTPGGGGLVFTVGDRFATRTLKRVRAARTPTGLRLTFPDWAMPPLDVAIDHPVWAERLGAV